MKIEAKKKRATAGWPLRNRVPQYAGVNVLDRDRIFSTSRDQFAMAARDWNYYLWICLHLGLIYVLSITHFLEITIVSQVKLLIKTRQSKSKEKGKLNWIAVHEHWPVNKLQISVSIYFITLSAVNTLKAISKLFLLCLVHFFHFTSFWPTRISDSEGERVQFLSIHYAQLLYSIPI